MVDQILIRLDPRKEKLARFIASGRTQTYAAEQISVSKQTINAWVQEKLVQERIEQLRTDVFKQAEDLLIDSIVDAAEAVRDIALGNVDEDSRNTGHRLKAALYILELVKRTKIPAIRDNAKMDHLSALDRMDDEEIDELLDRFPEEGE